MPSLIASATTHRYQQKREDVLRHAALLFNQHGLKGTTLSSIADSVGLATNSVTYYYRKKEDLAKACLLRAIAAFDNIAEQAMVYEPGADRLRAYFHGHAELLAKVAEGRHAPVMYFRDVRALPAPQAKEVFAAYNAMFRRVRALLKGERTDLKAEQLNARAHLVLSVASWVGPWMDSRYEPADYGRVAHRISDTFIHGLGGRCSLLPNITSFCPELKPDAGFIAESFLRTATMLVNEQGYRGASVDKIAARMNLTKGAFYHHNDNKLELISACFERTFSVMRQTLTSAQNAHGCGLDRAFSAALALVNFQISPDGPLLRASALAALPDEVQREQALNTQHRLTERMTAMLVDGMVDGSVCPLDPGIAAQMIIAGINAAATLNLWVPGVDAENVADFYVRSLFEGVLSSGSEMECESHTLPSRTQASMRSGVEVREAANAFFASSGEHAPKTGIAVIGAVSRRVSEA